jgi:hypothetical protein
MAGAVNIRVSRRSHVYSPAARIEPIVDSDRKLRPLLRRAIADPAGDMSDLRFAVREVAFRARQARYPVDGVVRALAAMLDQVAPERTPYFNYDQVRERIALWIHTVYRRG